LINCISLLLSAEQLDEKQESEGEQRLESKWQVQQQQWKM